MRKSLKKLRRLKKKRRCSDGDFNNNNCNGNINHFVKLFHGYKEVIDETKRN